MSGIRILLVEDNKKVQEFNRFQFEEQGYAVETAFTLAEARGALGREAPGLIILDINMPDGDGRDFLRELRASGPAAAGIPVLMLTGYGKDADVVAGFESGCNDYLAKPYSFPVLLMRAKELLRRAERRTDGIEKGSLRLDISAGRAFIGGEGLPLKPKEFLLLLYLARREDEMVSAEQLYEAVWKAAIGGNKGALQTRISALRKALEDGGCGYTVTSIRGRGYRFERI